MKDLDTIKAKIDELVSNIEIVGQRLTELMGESKPSELPEPYMSEYNALITLKGSLITQLSTLTYVLHKDSMLLNPFRLLSHQLGSDYVRNMFGDVVADTLDVTNHN